VRRTTTARRGIAAAALAVTLGVVLAACSGDSSDDASATPSPSASETSAANAADEAAVDSIVVTGDPGTQPTITLPTTPFTVSTVVVTGFHPICPANVICRPLATTPLA